MADNPITTPLPADLPEQWTYGQTVGPNGTDVGLTEQHGYNYLMRQVNATQEGVNALGEAFAEVPVLEGGKVPVSQLPVGTPNGVAGLDSAGKVPSSQLPDMDYVPLSGGTMTGPLVLPGNPTANLQAAPKQYIDSVASTLNTALASRARIQTGSYVGTGTYGSSNPCSLTFDFVPRFVVVSIQQARETHAYHIILIMVYGVTYCAPDYDGSSGTSKNTCISGWGTKTIKWYSNGGAREQYNESGLTHYWVAIG